MLVLSASIYFITPSVTFFINDFAKNILSDYFPSDLINIIEKSFVKDIYILSMPEKYPEPLLPPALFLFSLLSIFLIIKTKLPAPVVIWIVYSSIVNLISSIFFIFFYDQFPYNIEAFTELYIKTEVNIWIFIPIIMGMALSSLPSRIFSKVGLVVLTIIYSMILGLIRYVAFIYVLADFSLIFMPLLFFAFGPFMDFVYIVGMYSLYISNYAKKIGKDLRIWKWLS
ncbi:MAG: hypothetical protein LLF28_02045 [Nitrospiraceae bacterium]|nr:hypothetical protein [Nitrospiraceae bacterium]